MNYLHCAIESGIRNIEMESAVFAAMCNRSGLPGNHIHVQDFSQRILKDLCKLNVLKSILL